MVNIPIMRLNQLKIPIIFAIAKIVFHLITNTNWSFQRDEFLYIMLGRNPDWGYWSIPPFTGWISWLGQHTIGAGQGDIRFWAALFSAGTVFLCCLMARDMGGKRFAQILAGIAASTSLAGIRSGHMFQPVVIDIFFWALASWVLIRYLKSENGKWLLGLGLVIGFGFLNKYTVLFLMAAMAIGLALTPARKIFNKKDTWIAAGLAFVIVLPNLWWQWAHNFPVTFHISELAENQLSAVRPLNFLLDQFLMHLFSFLVWLPGYFFLLGKDTSRTYRPLGWFALATVLLFLVTSGKSYYTLGIYSVLIAAGGVFWEQQLQRHWQRWVLALFVLSTNLFSLPTAIPIMSVDKTVDYFEWLGVESLVRWERGNLESLPQDYADMLGWEEIAELADAAVNKIDDPSTCLIYAENYGQAGAIQYYGKYPERVVSFSDNYRIWMPEEIDPAITNFIYVNDELGEDIQSLFNQIQSIGTVDTPHARERGTQVYLCQQPKKPFNEFWNSRVQEVKAYYRLDK
jgi:hypothetical protein